MTPYNVTAAYEVEVKIHNFHPCHCVEPSDQSYVPISVSTEWPVLRSGQCINRVTSLTFRSVYQPSDQSYVPISVSTEWPVLRSDQCINRVTSLTFRSVYQPGQKLCNVLNLRCCRQRHLSARDGKCTVAGRPTSFTDWRIVIRCKRTNLAKVN
jgi:hypothetical protein